MILARGTFLTLLLLIFGSKHNPSHLESVSLGHLLGHLVLLGRLESRIKHTLVHGSLLEKFIQVRLEILQTILELRLFINQTANLDIQSLRHLSNVEQYF